MTKIVVRRSGEQVPFDKQRIVNAISKACEACLDGDMPTRFINGIADKIANKPNDVVHLEQIQDWIVGYLMHSPYPTVAVGYIQYRHDRDKARRDKQNQVFASIVNVENNDITRENANMNADTPAGMMMKFASESSKAYTDDNLLSADVLAAVNDNLIHIHDKDYYATKSLTCVQHPLDKILGGGFRANHGSSRPAKRIETAAIQACISLETVQNEMHTLNCAA